MSYSKAQQLLRLADFAASRYRGITLAEIAETFEVSHRTAQRMTAALGEVFPHSLDLVEDENRQRRWVLRENRLSRLRLTGDEELEALEYSISRLKEDGDFRHAQSLMSLRDRLLAALPPQEARRAEADAEAMLEVHGIAARPGPVVTVDTEVPEAIIAALRGPYRLVISYGGSRREIEPYGILLGARRYLVARQPDQGPTFKHFRLDRIASPAVTDEWFARDPSFNLVTHAARAFGSYQADDEYGEVVWRFTPEAAERAAEWRFHPKQTSSVEPDGSLIVRFSASGWLEMAWHLYQWGNQVEVLAPAELREMIDANRRIDFPSLP